MSRIEKTTESVTQPQALRDEVVESFEPEPKHSRSWLSCSSILFICVVFLFGLIACVVAATGLVHVPGVSRFAFSEPVPVRIVPIGVSAEVQSETQFQSILTQRLQEQRGILTDRSVSLEITESALTTTLQNQLGNISQSPFIRPRAQIVILEEGPIEVFLPFRVKDQETTLVIQLGVEAKDGRFDLHLSEVRVGSVQVPRMLVASMIQPFVTKELASLNQVLSSYMRVEELRMERGILKVSGMFTVELK